MADNYLTRQQAAERLQCSTQKIDALRREGAIDSVKLGYKTVRIPEQSVDALLVGKRKGK